VIPVLFGSQQRHGIAKQSLKMTYFKIACSQD